MICNCQHVMQNLKCIIKNFIVNFTIKLEQISKNSKILFIAYKFYLKMLSLISVYPYKVINHHMYAKKHTNSSMHIIQENRIGFTSNSVFGHETPDYSLIPVEMPDLYYVKHENVKIHGNSDFIINKDENVVINDFAYQMSEKFDNKDGILLKQKGDLLLLRFNDKIIDKFIDSGIMISGKFSSNYYHVIYEILIKLLLINKTDIPDNVPIIVDSIIYKVNSFKRIFETLCPSNRQVILIDRHEAYKFKTIYWLSSINTIPPHIKNLYQIDVKDIAFDLAYINILREKLIFLNSNKIFPKKIFLKRKKNSRRNFNEDEIVEFLKKYEFAALAPESYTFGDQIAMFNNADFIIGGSGAAMSNLLFCNRGCKIICIQSRRTNYPLFTTIAYSQGLEMKYCIGSPLKSSKINDIHASFRLNTNDLEETIKSFYVD